MLEVFVRKYEKPLFFVLLLTALIRVFLFSAAFPFFNNVDEAAHFDTVVKYARGYFPRQGEDHFDKESARLIVLKGSPEYIKVPEDFPAKKIPPPIRRSAGDELSKYLKQAEGYWLDKVNHEVFSPPVYYLAAAAWYDAGKLIGLSDGFVIYWIRFLNIIIYGLLLWMAYLFCREYYPENPSLRTGVVLLLAFFPQDVFYSINSDVLSPLLFLVSLYLLAKIYVREIGLGFYLLTGMVLAMTLLTKLTNCPILLLAALVMGLKIRQGKGRTWSILGLIFALLLPLALWSIINLKAGVGLIGSSHKIEYFGWTLNELGAVWQHPVFTIKGLSVFLGRTISSFWRGEFVWGMSSMAWPLMDNFYVISSLIFVAGGIIGAFWSKPDRSMPRLVDLLNVVAVVASFLFLVLISLVFDFGQCWHPSPDHPYFSSGRLIMGVLVPFLILYLQGLDLLLKRVLKRVSLVAVVLLIAGCLILSEISLSLEVFSSQYNWFHLF